MLTREMKSWDKVSSFRGANTLFQGQQIQRGTNTDHRRSKDKSKGTWTAPKRDVRESEYIVKRYCSDD
jgi:hypothetical protein